MSLATTIGRALLAGVFIRGSWGQLTQPEQLAGLVARAKNTYGLGTVPIDPAHLVTVNGAVMLGAGSAMALGLAPRTSACALIGALVPTTVVGHAFWAAEDPAKRYAKLTSFLANVAIIGGLILVAADPSNRCPAAHR